MYPISNIHIQGNNLRTDRPHGNDMAVAMDTELGYTRPEGAVDSSTQLRHGDEIKTSPSICKHLYGLVRTRSIKNIQSQTKNMVQIC